MNYSSGTGLRDPIIELIEKYMKQKSITGTYGIGSGQKDSGGGSGNSPLEPVLIDHTHIFESDEPLLLKPIKLEYENNKLKTITCGQGELVLITTLFYNELGKFYKVSTLYPDGNTVFFELDFESNSTERRGKLLRVL